MTQPDLITMYLEILFMAIQSIIIQLCQDFLNTGRFRILVEMIPNLNSMCRNNSNFYIQCSNTFTFPANGISTPKKKKNIRLNFPLFLRTLLKFEIISTRIGQVIKLRNYTIFFKHLVHLK